jgi:hypothetical protein
MSCDPCAPKAFVTCLPTDADKYLFYIHGLEPGQTYYWVLEDNQGRRFTKSFTYNSNPYVGFTLEILASEVPAGLFAAARQLWFHITKEVSGETKVPFLFAHYVEQLQVNIICDEFHEPVEEVGLEVIY